MNHDYKPYNITFPSIKDSRKSKILETPQRLEKHYDPQDLNTTYGVDYTPHKIEDNEWNRSPSPNSRLNRSEYRPSPHKLEDQTEYKANYQEKSISPESRVLSPTSRGNRSGYRPSPHKLEGETEYNVNYVKKVVTNAPKR